MNNTKNVILEDAVQSFHFGQFLFSTNAIVAFASIAILYLSLVKLPPVLLGIAPHESVEPPIVKPRIPFVGHVLGMVREQSAFHRNLA